MCFYFNAGRRELLASISSLSLRHRVRTALYLLGQRLGRGPLHRSFASLRMTGLWRLLAVALAAGLGLGVGLVFLVPDVGLLFDRGGLGAGHVGREELRESFAVLVSGGSG